MDRRNKKGSIALANQLDGIDKAAKTFMGFPIVTRGQREHAEALDMVSSTREVLGDDHSLTVSPLDEISDGPFGSLDDEEAGVFEQVPDPPEEEELVECKECDGYGSCGVCSGGCDCQECDTDNEEEMSHCPYCDGSGSCWKCNGLGDCDECDGLGTLPKGGK